MFAPINLITLITILGVFLGITLGSFLTFVMTNKNKGNVFLGIKVFFATLYLLPGFFYILGLLESMPHVIKLHSIFSGSMVGPITYFYVKKSTQSNFKLSLTSYLHFIPAVLFLIYYFPFYLQNGTKKIEHFINLTVNGVIGNSTIPHIIQALLCLAYFIISIRMVLLYKNNLPNTTSSIDVAFHRWLLVFSTSLLLPGIIVILFLFMGIDVVSMTLIHFSIFFFIFCVFLAVLIKPAIFYSFPHQLEVADIEKEKVQKYENSNLKEPHKERYLNRLTRHMKEHQPYQESELTLPQLAEQTKIPVHHLSQIINEKLDCNFLDFINGYRVEDAKTKLLDDKYNHYTIIAIAYEVGFNSKSAFYSAFKKQTNTTPGNYRKAVVTV